MAKSVIINKAQLLSLLIVVAAAIVLATWVLVWFLPSWGCERKWRDSGMGHRYVAFTGCQVETKPGKWVNDTYIRTLEE
jgi:hypothetical protein